MRIFYISHTHPTDGNLLANAGGMQRVSYQLAKALKEKPGVELFTETIHAGYGGNVNFQTAKFLFKNLFTLKRKSVKYKADVILFSSMVTASLAPFLKKRIDIPFVAINHGRDVTLPSALYQRLVPYIFNALDGVISVSEATRRESIKRGMAAEKGVALGNGIDTERFTFPDKDKSRAVLQKKFNIPLSNRKMLLTVGRFVKRKGHRWFIEEVLPRISNEVVYVTVGSGPELKNVKQAASKSKLSDKIFILGRQPDAVLKQAYAAADLFVMPNIPVEGDMEGFGIVMPEANLAETPAIASDIEGIKDVISDGKNGYKVPALDAQKFAEQVDDTLSDSLNLLSTRSRKYVQEQFSWTNVSQRYLDFLEQTIAKSGLHTN